MKSAILIAIALTATFSMNAQTWQWGKRGGCQFDGVNSQPHEQIKDIATDRNGNVYALGLVESSGGASVDGHSLTLYGFKDVVLTSFSCNGTYRWTKVIGGASNDMPIAVATDTVGHVYVTTFNLPPTNFSSDTTSPVNSAKSLALLQYDTLGNFKWLRQPQSDTGTYTYMVNNSDTYDLHVEGNGEVSWLLLLPAGLVSGGGGWALPSPSTCVVKYNAQGAMINHSVLQIQTTQVAFTSIRMAQSKSGRVIVAGTYDPYNNSGTFSIGGQPAVNDMFMAAFSAAGQLLWKKENTLAQSGSRLFSRPQIDAQGNIYYSGDGQLGDSFNGANFYNNRTTLPYTTPFIAKADSNGNHLWLKCASGTAVDAGNSIVLKGNNEVLLSGTGNSVWWDTTHRIQGAPNCGYYIYTNRFDAAGNILGMDSLKGTFGADNFAYCNTVDRNGNLFIGGEFNITLNINSTQSISNSGGRSDFFIAKFGYPCGCTAPVANYTSTTTAVKTVQFTYTGTSTGIDSLIWNFGDGQRLKVTSGYITPTMHTYAANGHYITSATVYGLCGSDTYSKSYTLDIGTVAALSGVKFYPNPVSDYFTIEGAEGSSYLLLNSIGQQIASGTISNNIHRLNTAVLPADTYMLQIIRANGMRGTTAFIKN